MENENTQTNIEKEVDVGVSKTKKHSTRTLFLVVFFILTIVISSTFGAFFGFLAGGLGQGVLPKYLGHYTRFFNNKNNPVGKDIIRQQIVEEDSAVIDVVDKSAPAVVSIVVSKDVPMVKNFFFSPFNFDPFGENQDPSQGDSSGGTQKQKIGGGTGFFITSDGMIVTNKHVVSDAVADYTVITNDGKEYSAKVLARDPINDVAVIKIDGQDFPTLNFGDSDSLKIGQTVIAIGNSLGEFSNTVSRGIISGLRRNLTAGSGQGETEKLSNIIQTDAAINPGNSGGPLLNINGEVIGINVAIAQDAQNVGFAIPSLQIKKIVEQVKTTGKISTPYIGVRYVLIDDQIKQESNLPFNYGALIVRGQKITDFAVIPGSPADKAGLVENDIILEINGTKIDDKNGLTDLLAQHSVGDELTLKVWHKGETKEIKIKLEERG